MVVAGCLVAGISIPAGGATAWAAGPKPLEPPPSSGVIKGEDQYNASGELVGGSVTILPGVITTGEDKNFTVTPFVSVGGGTWDYGTSINEGWSNYIHPARHHGATTKQGGRQDREDMPAGVWAKTRLARAVPGPVIEAFWR
ncbi:lactococcin 972 family bacteriocin [Pseudonocardia sp. ICBG1293]|uniref:lactococcin 972 family bacteriocin n=1 Tax=Pseudonocardia sp. ICBG1293 TaxID=2844382 RepID=UPI001CCAE21F